jgi:hypothetical protein
VTEHFEHSELFYWTFEHQVTGTNNRAAVTERFMSQITVYHQKWWWRILWPVSQESLGACACWGSIHGEASEMQRGRHCMRPRAHHHPKAAVSFRL